MHSTYEAHDQAERDMEDHGRLMYRPGEMDYFAGFHLYADGFPLSLCQNDGQRQGWHAAARAAGYDGMSARQLTALGV